MTETPRPPAGPHDWNLPNAELTRIWRVKSGVVRRMRAAGGHPRPLWDLKKKRARADPGYRAALAAEEEKARGASGNGQ